ncbi:unnamed protein product [Clonostachys rhizophaga]|uniref:Uncharacterized protein n=1 Tax=Clonostachys rhizophaga TaxID=160324 RepID=A0A9N9YUD2_9HYPO|nr:unnamed protein product [Clonostachys rhizophaga]
MARTRAQGKKPQGVQKSVNTRRAHPQKRVSHEPSNLHPQLSLSTKVTPLPDFRPSDKSTKRGIGLDHDSEPPQKRPRRSLRLNPTTPTKRGAKRNVETPDSDTPLKQSRRSPIQPATAGTADRPIDPTEFWAKERVWPQEYFNPGMAHIVARKRSQRSLSRKRSNSGAPTSTTPSDQRPREEKSTPYRDPRYKTLLATKNSFMEESDLGISKDSKDTYLSFLSSDQTIPDDFLS